jgi:DNA end-binding protein Ku
MAARATWKGVLQISLVAIPIKVYPATESSDGLAFHQLHAVCQSRVQQKKWCGTCAREISGAEIVKGFEFEKGRYVLLLPEELDAVQPPSLRVIDLVQFVPAAALDPVSIDRAYYLAPDGPLAGAAYAVMREAMTGVVGIGKLAIYGREYLVAVGPQHHGHSGLMLYTLHHAAEIRALEAIAEIDELRAAPLEEVRRARQLVTAFTRPLNLADFTDEYRRDVQRLIDAKVAGHEIVIPPVVAPPTLALVDALTQSLAALTTTKIPAKRKRA